MSRLALALALFLALAALLHRTMAMSARRDFGSSFLWTAFSVVVLGVAGMATLYRTKAGAQLAQ